MARAAFAMVQLSRSNSTEEARILLLPDELVLHIASCILIDDLPAAMWFATCCGTINAACIPLQPLAEQRRLRWEAGETTGHVITLQGRALTRCGGRWTKTWAVGNLLPARTKASYSFRIDRCAAGEGVLCLGVCDEHGRHAYGLSPYSGKLSSLSRQEEGQAIQANTCPPPEHEKCVFVKQLMPAGTNLKGRANGATVEFTVDSEAGVVQVRINKGQPVDAISGLPCGVRLRPWARLFDVPDRITMTGYWTPR